MMINGTEANNCHLVRHVETYKNNGDIHGKNADCRPTNFTEAQLSFLEHYCVEKKLKRVLVAPTAQCKLSGDHLVVRSGLELVPLGLNPIDLGMFAGLSHYELRKQDPKFARAMEQFRYRLAPFNKTALVEISDPRKMTNDIMSWSSMQKREDFDDSLVILSNSLLVELLNWNYGIVPESDRYFNIGVANAGIIQCAQWSPDVIQWPSVVHKTITSPYGEIIMAEYVPKISPYDSLTAVIHPGIFGGLRFGPYNLFNRLARRLADQGIRSVVFDAAGSGESVPIFRSMETELSSLNAVIDQYTGSQIALCAHSLSANIAGHFIHKRNVRKYLIAPILNFQFTRSAWKMNINRDEMSKHGLLFSSDFWDDNKLQCFTDIKDAEYFFGSEDAYVDHGSFLDSRTDKVVFIVNGAGHNFIEENTSNDLIRLIESRILNWFWFALR